MENLLFIFYLQQLIIKLTLNYQLILKIIHF